MVPHCVLSVPVKVYARGYNMSCYVVYVLMASRYQVSAHLFM